MKRTNVNFFLNVIEDNTPINLDLIYQKYTKQESIPQTNIKETIKKSTSLNTKTVKKESTRSAYADKEKETGRSISKTRSIKEEGQVNDTFKLLNIKNK